jgi:hypothetical protein
MEPTNMTAEQAMQLADALYSAAYDARKKERDFDPRGCKEWQEVVDALTAPRVPDELRSVVADIRAHCNPPNPETCDEVSASYALYWADRIEALIATAAAPADDDTCPECGQTGAHREGCPDTYLIGHKPKAPAPADDLATLRERVKVLEDALADAASYTRHSDYDWDMGFIKEVDHLLTARLRGGD